MAKDKTTLAELPPRGTCILFLLLVLCCEHNSVESGRKVHGEDLFPSTTHAEAGRLFSELFPPRMVEFQQLLEMPPKCVSVLPLDGDPGFKGTGK